MLSHSTSANTHTHTHAHTDIHTHTHTNIHANAHAHTDALCPLWAACWCEEHVAFLHIRTGTVVHRLKSYVIHLKTLFCGLFLFFFSICCITICTCVCDSCDVCMVCVYGVCVYDVCMMGVYDVCIDVCVYMMYV